VIITNKILRTYSRLWAIWIADQTWATTVTVHNRIRYDQDDKPPARSGIADSAKPADYPAVMLEVEDFSAESDSAAMTFGSERGECERPNRLQVTFAATVASESLRIGQLDLLPVRMIDLILAQPSSLGITLVGDEELPFIEGLGKITSRAVKTKRGLASGTLRRLTTIRIPVNIVS
jgi:hypothetical protein